jgi:hypothetical protein
MSHLTGLPLGNGMVADRNALDVLDASLTAVAEHRGVVVPPNNIGYQRLFHIPTAKVTGNLGQSPVWYGGTDQFRARALASW